MPRKRLTNPDQLPWQGAHVQKILKDSGKPRAGKRRYALIFGWPTPVSELARTQMPPLPGRPSYCFEARRWARRMLNANRASKARVKPKKRWIGAYTLRWLRAVEQGRQPLAYCRYHSLQNYFAPPPAPAPAKLAIRLGGGLRVGFAATLQRETEMAGQR